MIFADRPKFQRRPDESDRDVEGKPGEPYCYALGKGKSVKGMKPECVFDSVGH